jgi:uncharacterized protein YchJ
MDKIPTINEIDPEFDELVKQVANGKLNARISDEDVYLIDANGNRKTLKVGRNDPCLCGSGKKYKKCCGKK